MPSYTGLAPARSTDSKRGKRANPGVELVPVRHPSGRGVVAGVRPNYDVPREMWGTRFTIAASNGATGELIRRMDDQGQETWGVKATDGKRVYFYTERKTAISALCVIHG